MPSPGSSRSARLPHRAPDLATVLSRRGLLAAVAGSGLLAGCGRPDDAAGSRGSGSSASATSGTRTVPSDNGPVTVPADPQRVVAAIGSFEIDMVAVGVMPVLTTSFAGPWVDLASSVTVTDNVPPAAEEVVAAAPDLMVGWTWVTKEPVFDTLKEIAPYVGLGETESTAGAGFNWSVPLESWNQLFLSVCDAVNRRDQGVELVAGLESRIDEVAEKRSGRGEVSVARIEFRDQGSFSYRGRNEDTAALMERVGLTVVGPELTDNEASLETLPDIDADWLVVPVGGGSMTREVYEQVAATELFRAVPAVRAGRVHVVDGALWPGLGHLWAGAVLDDLERLFA